MLFRSNHYDSLREEDELYQEQPDEEQLRYIRRVTETTEAHRDEIDGIISRYAQGWKLNRISRSTLAVLRCAICEILYLEDVPNGAAVNEAVELGKTYDSPEAGAFINGVLGSFLRSEISEGEIPADAEPETEEELPAGVGPEPDAAEENPQAEADCEKSES